MMLVIPKGREQAQAGTLPVPALVEKMMKYNESPKKAGVLLALDGLHPPAMGTRVTFSGGKPTVKDGPFAEAKEVLGGYWMIRVKSRAEAIEWASRAPMSDNEILEAPPGAGVRRFPAGDPEAHGRLKRDAELPGEVAGGVDAEYPGA